MPSTPSRILIASTSPDLRGLGRSICVMSPVITALELAPMRVRNIFICSMVVFCASSMMMKASLSVRPRMNANDAFIIMDEAQNTTIEQMKMFLTRMGANSKAVITGDITQIDLPNPRKSGLLDAINILDGVEGIHFCHFEDLDVVRHALVQRIVRAYESAKPQQQELPLAMGEAMRGWCGDAAGAEAGAGAARWRSRSNFATRVELKMNRGRADCGSEHDDPSRPRFGA